MFRKVLIASACASYLAACATASVIQVAQDSLIVQVKAGTDCGPHAAIQLAQKQAAIETIRAGFDRYIVVGADASGSPAFGQAALQSQTLTIKMFREGDNGAENALSARQILGPDWQEQIKRKDVYAC
ncbi:hypothetical protein ACUSIJ_25055 [Pseudochelatococcus sp. B33]